MEHLYRTHAGDEIERKYRRRAPEKILVKGEIFHHVRMLIPGLAPSVGQAGRKGHDGYFTANSLPRDPGGCMGFYDRVDKQGRPQFASRSERERAMLKLNRVGYDYQYNEKPEVDVQKTSTDTADECRRLRPKLAKHEAAGQKVF